MYFIFPIAYGLHEGEERGGGEEGGLGRREEREWWRGERRGGGGINTILSMNAIHTFPTIQ